MRRFLLILPAVVLGLSSGAASAQAGPGVPAGSVGRTVDGLPPEKTGSTTAVGQTKPPGDALGAGMGTRPDLEQQSRDLDKRIDTGICSGCK